MGTSKLTVHNREDNLDQNYLSQEDVDLHVSQYQRLFQIFDFN